MKGWIGATLLVLLGVLAVAAQEIEQIADAQNAAGLFQDNVRNVSLSPDGTMLAGTNEQLCVLTLASGDEACYAAEDSPQSALGNSDIYNPLVWSPDSSKLLFTENLYVFLNEPDLWMLDLTTGEITNLTDDGIFGGAMFRDETGYTLDYLPAFAPNGDIYFFRAIPPKEGGSFAPTLQRLAVGADEPEEVSDAFSSAGMHWGSIFYSPMVSPDGTQMVFPVAEPDRSAEQNGLWLVDLESGEIRQLTDADDTHAGMPKYQQDARMATLNPVWTANGEGIVFRVFNPEMGIGLPVANYMYVDVASGDVRPLLDFTHIGEFSELVQQNSPEILLVPRAGAVSADGNSFISLGYNLEASSAQLVRIPLPPDGSDPEVLGQVEVELSGGLAVPNLTVSEANNALLGGWLFSFE